MTRRCTGGQRSRRGQLLKHTPIGLKLGDNKAYDRGNMLLGWGQRSYRGQILKLLRLGSNLVTTTLLTGGSFCRGQVKGHRGQLLKLAPIGLKLGDNKAYDPGIILPGLGQRSRTDQILKLLRLDSSLVTTILMTGGSHFARVRSKVTQRSNLKIAPIGLKLSDNKPHDQENISNFIYGEWGQMSHRVKS